MNASAVDQEELRLAIVDAHQRAKRVGCVVHVTQDELGRYFASEFLPAGWRSRAGGWLRVTGDGRIEQGITGNVLGNAKALTVRAVPLSDDEIKLLEARIAEDA